MFKLKLNDQGKIDRHKARLMSNILQQRNNIDYAETFALVVKPAMIRLIISIVVTRNWKL